MARHGYGNRYGMSVNGGGMGGGAADLGVYSGDFDNELSLRSDEVFEVRDGVAHWVVDDAYLDAAGDAGLFPGVYAWGGLAFAPCLRPMRSR